MRLNPFMQTLPNFASRIYSRVQQLTLALALMLGCSAVQAICTSNANPASWTNPSHWVGTCTGGPNAAETVVVLANTVVNIPAGSFSVAGLTLNDGVDLNGASSASTFITSTGDINFQGSSLSIRLNNISVSGSAAGALKVMHNIEINNGILRNKYTGGVPSEVVAGKTVTFDGSSTFFNDVGAKLKIFGGTTFVKSPVTGGPKSFRNFSAANNAVDIQGAVSIQVEIENDGEIFFPNLSSELTIPDGFVFDMSDSNSVLTGSGKLIAAANDITIANGRVSGSMQFQVGPSNKVVNSGGIFTPGLGLGVLGTIAITGSYSQLGTGKYLVDIDATGSDQISTTAGINIANGDIFYRQGVGAAITNASTAKTVALAAAGGATFGAPITLQNVFTAAATPVITPIAIRTTLTSNAINAARSGSRMVVSTLTDFATPTPGQLRDAIVAVNGEAPGCANSPYRVRFNVTGTISLGSALPALGACETGINAHEHHITEIAFGLNSGSADDASNAAFGVTIANGGSVPFGFEITGAAGARIAGLAITGFPTGIKIGAAGNTVATAAIHGNAISGGANGIEVIEGNAVAIGGAYTPTGTTLLQNLNIIHSNSSSQIMVSRTAPTAGQLTIEGNLLGRGPAGSPAITAATGISVTDVASNNLSIKQNVIATSLRGIFINTSANNVKLNEVSFNRIYGGGLAIARAAPIAVPIFTFVDGNANTVNLKLTGTNGDVHDVCVCENNPGETQCRRVRACSPVGIGPSGDGTLSLNLAPPLASGATITAYAVSTGGSNAVRGTSQLSLPATLPTYAISPPSTFTYADTLVGTQLSQTFIVQNVGAVATQIDAAGISISGVPEFVIPIGASTCKPLSGMGPILAPLGACTIVVNFSPSAVTPFTGYLNISSVGFAGVSVTLVGNGIQPGINVTPTLSLNFGSVTVGSSSTFQLVQIDNPGTAPLTISAIATTSGFSLTTGLGVTCGTPPFNLAVMTNCSIGVLFAPTLGDTAIGQLIINNNAGAAVIRTLNGTGLAANTLTGVAAFAPATAIVGQAIQLPITISNGGSTAAAAVGFSYTLPTGLVFTTATPTSSCGGVLGVAGSVLTYSNGNIAVGANCVIEATLKAVNPGSFTVTLATVTSTNGGLLAPVAASLSAVSGAFIVSDPVNASTLAFGTVTPTVVSPPLTVKLTNDGNVASTISASIVGADAARFSLSNGCSAGLNAVSSCALLVTCAPTAAGALTASLQVTHGATNLPSPLQYPLTCIGGVPPPISYTLAPASTTIASTQIGATRTATFTLTTASRPLAITNLTVTGAGLSVVAGAGAGTCPPAGVVGAGSSCTIIVAYKPTAQASVTGQLTILSDAINTPTSTVNPSVASILASAPDAVLITPNQPFAFGSVNTGATSAAQSRTLANNTAVPISFTAFTVPAGYLVTDTCAAASPLAANASCVVTVTFKPTALGAQNGNVSSGVTSTAIPGGLSFGLLTSATGVSPLSLAASALPSTLAFGSVTLPAASGPQSTTIKNIGGVAITLDSLTLPPASGMVRPVGAAGGTCIFGSATAQLLPNDTCVITLIFAPSAPGMVNGEAIIVFSSPIATAGAALPLRVPLTATALAAAVPIFSITPASLSFLNQTVGQTSLPQPITIRNAGPGDLLLSAFTPPVNSGITRAATTVGDTCTQSPIVVGGFCVAFFTYKPLGIETVNGAITITSNAPTQSVSYTASSVAAPSPQFEISAATLDFAGQVINTTSTARTIAIRNGGTAPMTVRITSTGAVFVVNNNCPVAAGAQQVLGGQSCEVTVTFKPTDTITYTGSVSITHDATNAPTPAGIVLRGLGLPEPVAALSFTPATLDFGSQTLGISTTTPKVVIVRSAGAGAAKIARITNTGDFSFTSNCPLTPDALPPTFECNITVAFKPQTIAAQTGVITVESNVPATTPGANQITLKGAGSPVPVPNIDASVRRLDYPTLTVGTVSDPQSIVIKNAGFANLRFAGFSLSDSSFALSGIRGRDVAVDVPPCGSTLSPSDVGCWISVVFAPRAVGNVNAELAISSNVAGGALRILLTGTGAALPKPLITLSTSTLNFGEIVVSTTSQAQTVTISNRGDALLSVGAITVSNADFAIQTPSTANACNLTSTTLAVNASCVVQIVFSAITLGAKTANLNIASDSNSVASTDTVGLSGTAIAAPAPVIRTTITALGFGNTVFGGATPSQSVVFSNTGTAPLLVASITTLGDFIQSTNCPPSLAVGATCTVAVSFSPLGLGSRGGELQIRSNATPNLVSISLGGTGCRLFSIAGSRIISTLCAP